MYKSTMTRLKENVSVLFINVRIFLSIELNLTLSISKNFIKY